MELIIQKIIEKISISFEKDLKNLIMERGDISEFILHTKKTLDEVGVSIVAEALETIDEAYRNSQDRKRKRRVKKHKRSFKAIISSTETEARKSRYKEAVGIYSAIGKA